MTPKYILYYFDFSGRGEGIRYLLSYKKVDFEDRRIPFDQWPALKSQMPAGQIPVLECSGKKLAQSAAICRYLGNEHGLNASSNWDKAKLDEAVDVASDLLSDPMLRTWFHEKDEKKKESIRGEIIEKGLPPKFDNLLRVSCLSETHPFLNGAKPTWADFYVAGLLTFLDQAIFNGQLAVTNKGLSDYHNRVMQLDGVKEYGKLDLILILGANYYLSSDVDIRTWVKPPNLSGTRVFALKHKHNLFNNVNGILWSAWISLVLRVCFRATVCVWTGTVQGSA